MSQIELGNETISKLAQEIMNENKKISKSESEYKLRNVKLLLENYRYIKNHLEIDTPIMENDSRFFSNYLSLISMMGYRVRSEEMLKIFNKVLEEFKTICYNDRPDVQRQYNVIAGLYLNERKETYTQLANRYHADVKTIRRDERKAIKTLKVMTFGIDGLNDMS